MEDKLEEKDQNQKTKESEKQPPDSTDEPIKKDIIPPKPPFKFTYSKKWVTLEVILFLIVIIAASTYSFYRNAYTPKTPPPSATPTPKITQTPTPTSTPDPTTDWKTYRNEKYGFEVKYPENFFISSEGPYEAYNYDLWVILTPKEWKDEGVHNPFVGVSVIQTNLSSAEWLKAVGTSVSMFDDLSTLTEQEKVQAALYQGVQDVQYKVSNVTSDGQIVLFSESRTSGSDYHVLMKGENNLLFNIHNHFSPNGTVPDNIFNQILSTFKFLDNQDWIIGINPKSDRCCPCPERIPTQQLGKNGWELYDSEENYHNCPNAICLSCPEIDTSPDEKQATP